MEKKKQTNSELQRRIDRALIHIDRTRDTKDIYFTDKGLRLIVGKDHAIIETGFHRHVFDALTTNGVSRPYLYTKRFLEIALEMDCKTERGYSYQKLFETLKTKEEAVDYNICWYYDLWLTNIFEPLYTIQEDATSSFLVYESYVHSLARNAVIFGEKSEDITNKAFIQRVIKNIESYTDNLEELVVFPKDDEQEHQEELKALSEFSTDETITGFITQ